MAAKKKTSSDMSGSLQDLFYDEVSKDKDLVGVTNARTKKSFPLGIDILDYKMGKLIQMEDGVDADDYYALGCGEGNLITVVGDSGSGKSTFAMQIACNIVDPYEPGQAWIEHFDEEEASSLERICMLHPSWSLKEAKAYYKLKESGMTVEKFYLYLQKIHDVKLSVFDKIAVTDDEYTDRNGTPIRYLPPTVVILDSLAVLQPNKIVEKNEMGTEMSTTGTARSFATLFRSIRRFLTKANIILIVVNHLLDDVKINMYEKDKRQVNYLPQGRTVYGGKTPVYLSNFVFVIEPGTKMKESEGFGFDGFINNITLAKNRSNKAGQKVATVFSQELGFSNIHTNYMYLKNECKAISGAGIGFYLKDLPEVKFSQKKLVETYNKKKQFREAFDDAVFDAYEKFIYVGDDVEDEEEEFDEDAEAEMEEAAAKKKKKKKK